MFPLPSSLHPTSNPRRATLNPLRDVFDSIPNRLSSLARNAIDSLANPTASCADDTTDGISYARDGGTVRGLATEIECRR